MLMIQFELVQIEFLLVNNKVDQILWNDQLTERSELILKRMTQIKSSQNLQTS